MLKSGQRTTLEAGLIDQISKIADAMFRTILPHSAGEHGIFRAILTVNVDGTTKPLLLVGNAHPGIEDGECIAILNPDPELMSQVHGGVAYGAGIKENVAGKCDAMAHLWIDAYGKNETSVIYKYTSRSPKPPKFKVD